MLKPRGQPRDVGQRAGMSLEGLTKRRSNGTIPSVFWPYRPREGFPSVPRWLMIVLLIVAAVFYVVVVNHFAVNPENGPPAP